MKARISLILHVLMLSFLVGPALGGTIHYVKATASGANDGSSWADAYNLLQDGLNAAVSTDQIWVAKGTYNPTTEVDGTGDRFKTFQMKNGVEIYGGFPNTYNPVWAERNPRKHETILSGDIGTLEDINDNCYHVFFHPAGTNLSSTAVLDGFTISGGNAQGTAPHNWGGGILNRDGNSPTIRNCIFRDNYGYLGGGIVNFTNCSPEIANCSFIENFVNNSGGGMFNNDNSNPRVTNCFFIGNWVVLSGGKGGGMYNSDSDPNVINCTFRSNSAAASGGAIENTSSSNLTAKNCIFWDNTAPLGPQIHDDGIGSVTVSYSDVEGGYSGTNNINMDPLFVDADSANLKNNSPCIDIGDPTGDYSGQTDIDEQGRVLYDAVDIGADEVFPIAGDVDLDGDVDLADIALLTAYWLKGN